jgi:uncharacterized damage-inducible protein DinB
MSKEGRPEPSRVAGERETLEKYLDYHRATLLWKTEGLSDEDLRRAVAPSGLTLLGLAKHLAYVERYWFQSVFAGIDVQFPWSDEDPDADFRVEPDETTEQILVLYRTECERSREISAAASLEDRAQGPRTRELTLRWILAHMVEETARHNGHADIIRELIDGSTGV